MKYLLWTSVAALAGCLTDAEALSDTTADASDTAADAAVATTDAVPPIDAAAPTQVETASFALG